MDIVIALLALILIALVAPKVIRGLLIGSATVIDILLLPVTLPLRGLQLIMRALRNAENPETKEEVRVEPKFK